MSQRVSNGAIYATGREYGEGTHGVNRTGRAFYVCDCCESRRQFTTREAADAHEDAGATDWRYGSEDGTYNDMP